jgi:hypothetical protein
MPTSKNLSNVNIGTAANSGDGDILREAFSKINDNFNVGFEPFGSDIDDDSSSISSLSSHK